MTGDWDTGLPYLAKGSDAELAEAAKKDLAQPSKSADQVAAGNLWWSLGEKKTGLEAARLKNRAAHWYALALPKLSGAVETKIRKRLDSLGGAGQYALEFDGRSSYVLFHNLVYTGATPITIEAVVKPNRDGNWGTVRLDRQRRSHRAQPRPRRQPLVLPRRCHGQRPRKRPQRHGLRRRGRRQSWTHVAAVYDGREIRLYVDGHRRDSQTSQRATQGRRHPLRARGLASRRKQRQRGQLLQGTGPRRCAFPRRPSTTTISCRRRLATVPATVALFNFTEGHGDRLRDASGRKVFGEIHGAQWVKLGDAEPRP